MGRAQGRTGSTATTVGEAAGFAIFGLRGPRENDTLIARHPTERARAEQQALLGDARAVEPTVSLRALANRLDLAATRPLLGELVDEIGVRPLASVQNHRLSWIRALALATAVSNARARTIVINRRRTLHIWPDGTNWPGDVLPLGVRLHTACGRLIHPSPLRSEGYARADHGAWISSAQRQNSSPPRLCRICAQHAAGNPECLISREHPPFDEQHQTAFKAAARAHWREQLLACLRAGIPDRGMLLELANAAYKQACEDTLLDAVCADPLRTFEHATGAQVRIDGRWQLLPTAEHPLPKPPADRGAWRQALRPLLDTAFSSQNSGAFAQYDLLRQLSRTLAGLPEEEN